MADGLPTLGALVAFVMAVEAVGRLDLSLFLPTFSAVARVWWQLLQAGPLLAAVLKSLVAFGIGFGAATAGGIVSGLVLGRFRLLGLVFDPFFNVMMSAPLVAFVPVLITLFGISDVVVVVTVFLFAFFVIVVNTRTGFEGTDRRLVEMARSYGAGELQLFLRVYVPAALPAIMVGLQLGIVNGVKGLVVGEMLLALVGLGEFLVRYANVFLITHLYAVIATIMTMALVASYAVQLVDRVLIRWK
ncbi:MAG: ABC transporter permease subunit [Armatimonadota bacterium]|nr:ABC transporter permease subunit [Armatimonadota bacterium]